MVEAPLLVNCPTCFKSVEWQNTSRWRPFCCKRCQLIDLGEWAAEEKRIVGQTTQIDDEFANDETADFFLDS